MQEYISWIYICRGSVRPTKYIPKISFNDVRKKVEWWNWTGILYYMPFSRHNSFTASGCQLGTTTTQCVTKSKLRRMTQNTQTIHLKGKDIQSQEVSLDGVLIQREGFQWHTRCSKENDSKGGLQQGHRFIACIGPELWSSTGHGHTQLSLRGWGVS